MSGRVHAEAKAAPKSSFTPVRTGLLAGYREKQLVSQPPLVQAKLTINQPHDRYEQEADRVADAVMRMPEQGVQRQPEDEGENELIQTRPLARPITPLVQRQVDEEEELVHPKLAANAEYSVQRQVDDEEEEEEKELLQTKALSERITPLVQRQVDEEEEEEEFLQTKELTGHNAEIAPDLESRIQAIRGGGQPLPKSARAYFEPRFGYDFGQVRVHSDARAVNAMAYTVGRDVVFGAGQYAPGASAGRQLLAHELIHVVQQDQTIQSASKRLSSSSKSVMNNIDFQKFSHSPLQIARTPRSHRRHGRSITVSHVTIYLSSNFIDFHTSVGLYRYDLQNTGLGPGEYASTVVVRNNDVNFTLSGMQGEGEFHYTIQPGQPNPSTFFANQTGVVFTITNESAPEISESSTEERDPNAEYLSIEEAMRRCQANDLPGVKVFPYRGTRFGGAPIMAHRDGDDIIVKQFVYVLSNNDFRRQTRTLPSSTFIGGVRLKRNEIVRVHTYEPRWYHLNITGSTEGDIENEFCVTGEHMMQIAEMSRNRTYFNIGLTGVDAVFFLLPVGKIVSKAAKPLLRGSRNLAIGVMLGLREAAPTAFAGIASRTGTVIVENQVVGQAASRALSQTTSHVVIELGEHTIAQTAIRAGATTVGARTATEMGGRTVIVTIVDTAGHQVASSFTTPTGDAALDAALDRSFRETFNQPVSQGVGQRAAPAASTVAPEIAAGFTRQQVIAFQRFLAKPFSHSEIRILETLWTQAARESDNAILTLANSRRLFNLHRNRFWTAVRNNNPEAQSLFENAGCVFSGRSSTAPYYILNGRHITMTIDHIIERQTAPHLALTGSNLRISFSRENSVVLRLLNQLDPFQQ